MNKEKFMTVKERLAKRFTNWAEKYMSGSEVGSDKISSPSHTHLCHGGIQIAKDNERENNSNDKVLLVRRGKGSAEGSLAGMGKLIMPMCFGGMRF
jgi:hypothetical protein